MSLANMQEMIRLRYGYVTSPNAVSASCVSG